MMSEKDPADKRSILNNINDGHNMFGDGESPSAERRPLLKGLAVSLGTVFGLSNTAAAGSDGKKSKMQQKTEAVIDSYKTPSDVHAALTEHGRSLISELSNRGFLKSTNTENLIVGSVNVQKAPAENDPSEGVYLTAAEQKGQFTSHLSIVKKTPTYLIRLNVQPQLGRSFATVKTREGDLVTVVDPSVDGDLSIQSTGNTDGDVSIQKTCGSNGYTCPPSACCTLCGIMQTLHEEICCLYPDGSTSCYEQPVDKCCDPITCC